MIANRSLPVDTLLPHVFYRHASDLSPEQWGATLSENASSD